MASVTIDAECYALRERPVSSSRLVLSARDQLLAQVDLEYFTGDLGRVARLVKISHSAAFAAGFNELHQQISVIAKKVTKLFDTTGLAFAKFKRAADAVLEELPVNHDLMLQGDVESSILNLQSNDDLAFELAAASEELARMLQDAAENANRALEKAQAHHSEREGDRKRLVTQMQGLEMEKSTAWETHTMILQSLSDCNKLYTQVARRERRAARRARVFGLFTFISSLDSLLQRTWSIQILRPISSLLASVSREVEFVKNEKKLILDAKHKQRRLNWEALEGVTRCSTQIREVKSDIDAIMAAIESLHSVVGECKRLSVVVMRMSAFWMQVHASMGRLSSMDVVRLLETTHPNSGKCVIAPPPGNMENRPGAGEGVCQVDDRPAALSREVPRQPLTDHGPDSPKDECDMIWEPCTALKRRMVMYYARWAAMSDVCGECLLHLVEAKDEAEGMFSPSQLAYDSKSCCTSSVAKFGDDDVTSTAGNAATQISGDKVLPGLSNGDASEVQAVRQSAPPSTSTMAARREVEALAASLRAELDSCSRNQNHCAGPSSLQSG